MAATFERKSGGKLSGFSALQNALNQVDKKLGKVGWLENSVYPDVQTKKGRTIPGEKVAYIATIQEFGYPGKGIPARPTMRPAVDANRAIWSQVLGEEFEKIFKGGSDGIKAMNAVLIRAKADVQKNISELQSPPLKEATKTARLRKSSDKKTAGLLDKPLVDSGYLLATVDYTIENL